MSVGRPRLTARLNPPAVLNPPRTHHPMKKYLVEFVGTFFLVFTIGMSVIAPGAGVFDAGSGNPFTRNANYSFGVAWKNGSQGAGMYITYSAVPEPGSMILAALASLGAGWSGRRRLRRNAPSPSAPEPPPPAASI